MRYLLTHSHFWHSLCPTFAQSSMGKEAFTHEDARDLICCCCGIRTTKKKRVTQNEQKLVQTYCKPNFDSTLREQPSGLCNYCRWYLYACQRGERWEEVGREDPRLRWDVYELEHGRFREAEHTPDSCQICELAKWNPVADPDPQKRYMLQSREPVPEEKKQTSFKFCSHCYQHIGRGIPHPCTPANAKKNLAKIISEMSEDDQGQMVAACAKNLASTSGVEQGTPMRLNQLKGGNPLTLTLGRTRQSKPKIISTDFMVSLQKTLNCSENKLLKVARDFRKEGVQFEANIREELQQLSHSLDALFKVEMLLKFRKVVDSCFGMELATSFREDIDVFNASVPSLMDYCNTTFNIKLEPTWKVHILVVHLKVFLEHKMLPLGVFCEQTSEAAHCIIKPTTQRFKRRSDHRQHGPKLFRAVTDFTSKNM